MDLLLKPDFLDHISSSHSMTPPMPPLAFFKVVVFGSKYLLRPHLFWLHGSIDGKVALAAGKSEVMAYTS